ncbi:MAG: DNA recombination protein RmuC [Pseudomonadota bacterium]
MMEITFIFMVGLIVGLVVARFTIGYNFVTKSKFNKLNETMNDYKREIEIKDRFFNSLKGEVSSSAKELSTQGDKVYEKFLMLTDNLTEIGDYIELMKKSYDSIMTKFTTSDIKDDTIIQKMQKIKELSLKVNMEIPPEFKNPEDEYITLDERNDNFREINI